LAGSDALADTDSDGLTNAEEFERRTDPSAATPGGLLVVLPDTGTRRVNEPYLELGNP
jgi:hypothetical protein